MNIQFFTHGEHFYFLYELLRYEDELIWYQKRLYVDEPKGLIFIDKKKLPRCKWLFNKSFNGFISHSYIPYKDFPLEMITNNE